MLISYVAMVIFLFLPYVESGRSRANARDIPACYYDRTAHTNGYNYCSNPLYKQCDLAVCCSPDHYCCYINGAWGCCRSESLTAYEITGIVTGVVAWVGNIIVIMACITPQIIRAVKRRFIKKSHKVAPADLAEDIEMKHRKHF